MTSYVFDIGEKPRQVGRALGHVRSELQKAFIAVKKATGLTQQKLATRLGVNRSVVNRQLTGLENLTYRTVVELAWAMGWEISFSMFKTRPEEGSNEPAGSATDSVSTGVGEAVVTNVTTSPKPPIVGNGSTQQIIIIASKHAKGARWE